MRIAVIGTGYVGLVTGTCFAEAGNQVTCVDIDKAKVAQMQNGQVPIFEPGLEDLFKRNIKDDRLHFTDSLATGIKDAEVIFMALPTPPGDDGSADLSYILGAAKDLGPLLKDYAVIINKSTVPVGTVAKVRDAIKPTTKIDFDVVSNPEFLREGRAIQDFQYPDRVVIGTSSDKAWKIMEQLYKPFVRSGNPLIRMDEPSAEMTKYVANAMLALRISFMNDIANLCEATGANIDDVRKGVGTDERIGPDFLFAGPGYGGSCFPKDVRALRQIASEAGLDLPVVEATHDVNETHKRRLAKKVIDYYKGDVKGKTFAIWGLAFKAKTDDIRESPALVVVEQLTRAGAKVVAFDPEAMTNVKKQVKNDSLDFADNEYDVLDNADALIVATEWDEFKSPDFARVKSSLKQPVIFDGRNLYDLAEMEKLGFYYQSIGRRVVRG